MLGRGGYCIFIANIFLYSPIELFNRAADLKLGSFEDGGLTSNFQPHRMLVDVGLFINLVQIGFDNGPASHVCKKMKYTLTLKAKMPDSFISGQTTALQGVSSQTG